MRAGKKIKVASRPKDDSFSESSYEVIAAVISAVICLAIGGYSLFMQFNRDSKATGTVGQLIIAEKEVYYEVNFLTVEKKKIQIHTRSKPNKSDIPFKTGDRVEVLYDHNRPGEAIVNADSEKTTLVDVSTMIVGVVILWVCGASSYLKPMRMAIFRPFSSRKKKTPRKPVKKVAAKPAQKKQK